MRLVKVVPSIVSIPDLMTESELNSLLLVKGYDAVSTEKASVLIKQISGIIYKITGQFFTEKILTISYSNKNYDDIENELFSPFRVVSISSILLNNMAADINNFNIYEDRLFYSEGFPYGEEVVTIAGTFGYAVAEGIPNDINTAIMYLLEDFLFGDKFDRMQSEGGNVTLGDMTIERKAGVGAISGNLEVDRLLAQHRWRNSPAFKNNCKIRYSKV